MAPRSPDSRDSAPSPLGAASDARDSQQSSQQEACGGGDGKDDEGNDDNGKGDNGKDAHMTARDEKRARAGATPKSAPPAGGSRPRPQSKKPEPTLLTDFLKGRPSPARVAAERRRRQSLDAVKAELRHEVKQGSIRRLQPPSGIHARVQAWQTTNGKAMATGDPEDAASEPTEVAFKDEVESVTEEDRVRIKLRQKKRAAPPAAHNTKPTSLKAAPPDHDVRLNDGRLNSPPKKRVVSDDNWRKRNRNKLSPKTQSHKPVPRDFVDKSSPNLAVPQKVKSWDAKNDVPETPSPHRRKVGDSLPRNAPSEDAPDSDTGETWSQGTAKIAPESAKSAPDSAKHGHDGITTTPLGVKHNDSLRGPKKCATKSADRGRFKVTASNPSTPKSSEQPRLSRSRDGRGLEIGGSNPLQAVAHRESPSERIETATSASDSPRTRKTSHGGKTDVIEIVEYADSSTDTPFKRPNSSKKSSKKKSTGSPRSRTRKSAEAASNLSEETAGLDKSLHQDSDLGSISATRSVADIAGEIPFGHSAFSELDLSLNKSRPRRAKTDKNTGINVFKKVVEEGKKIIHDINENQKQPVPSKPPSIEKWLNNTVDPFVDKANESSPASVERQHVETDGRRRSDSPKRGRASSPRQDDRAVDAQETKCLVDDKANDGMADINKTDNNKAIDDGKAANNHEADGNNIKVGSKTSRQESKGPKDVKAPQVGGLKRAGATRSSAFSPKPSGKRQLLGVLKEAFQGESSGHMSQPRSYQSQEERQYDDYNEESQASPKRRPSSRQRASGNAHIPGPRFRPPTSGRHELSTIVSEENCVSVESDLSSKPTAATTLTELTTGAKESGTKRKHNYAPGLKRSNKSAGLKRRLTSHSDLVSVLSLPDNASVPSRITDRRTRPSLRKTRGYSRGYSDDVTAEELLREFADDEKVYLRELRTLVDGVVPVLLSHAVDGAQASELFEQNPASLGHGGLPKSVVDMGVALEKLKNAHGKAPTADLGRLAHWAHGVVPIYNNYLKAWRMGFEDVVVNLAPAADCCPEEDSLLNALPRNENGDVVDRHGERVAVAHLLKRPLIRVKQMARFFKCVDSMMGLNDGGKLVQDFEDLQDKTRRRYREEVARMTDKDAANTNTTKTRELRTLEALPGVVIDGGLEVNAKDVFSLYLTHSNGQRLECQAELVQRDSSSSKGDLLIRESGHGRRSYLLFEPVSMSLVSARAGKDKRDLVVMVRGTHSGEPWYELLHLVSESPDQAEDWLDILPSSPVPPIECQVRGVEGQNAPTLAQTQAPESPKPPIDKDLAAAVADCQKSPPAACQPKRASLPCELSSGMFAEPETPSAHDKRDRSRPLSESMRPDARSLVRDASPKCDAEPEPTPPPPPVHQSLPCASSAVSASKPTLQAPTESKDKHGVKRRGSSPLKHEYLPSDVSNTSDDYSSTSESSDEDDMDSSDIPQTELGFSIQQGQPSLAVVESVVSSSRGVSSECSLAPSNSASQAGLHGHKTAPEANADRFIASISRWSDQGVWADLATLPCSIIVTAGLIEAYAFRKPQAGKTDQAILALDLTPVVLIRQSTALDLEIRSSVQAHCQIYRPHVMSGGNFRFRCHSAPECYALYMSVHYARLNNQKFIQLANEARFRSFGQGDSISRPESSSRRAPSSWFGRRNSYRSSVRAPSQSHDGASTTPSATPSASSFLRRLTGSGNLAFNIARSSIGTGAVNHHHNANSLYTSGSSSSGFTTLRSPSINTAAAPSMLAGTGVHMRLHLLAAAAKWEDWGNCSLLIRRPPPGWHQALRANHGLEKRVTATTIVKPGAVDAPRVVLDAVLGSGCFSPMGSRGIVCGVWEELRSGHGGVGCAPATGATGGSVKKWCFQFATVADANCVLRLVRQEVFAPA